MNNGTNNGTTMEQTMESKMQPLNNLYEKVVALNPADYEQNNGAYQTHKQVIDRELKAYNIMKSKINTSIAELITLLENFYKERNKGVGGGRRNKKRSRRHKKKGGNKMRATRTKH